MTIKAKIDLSRLIRTIPEIKEQFKDDLPGPLTKAIESDVTRSISPNKSKRFPRYSAAYGKAKKKAGHPRTVNLKLTGKMLNSLRTIKQRKKPLLVQFTDEKAAFHNDTGPGGNRRKIRRLLPSNNGETFNSVITNLLSDTLRKTVFKIIRRGNR